MRKLCTSCVDLLRLTKGVFEIKYPRKSKCLHCLHLVRARVSLPKWRNWPLGCAREPKRPGEARTAHPPASRREDSSREGPVWQALSGHKRSNTLAVELPPQARGTGTLIPSVRRLVWAGKHQLGNAAWGASFP